MRIIAVSTLRDFWQQQPFAESPLRQWIQVVSVAQWTTPQDVKTHFGSASILPDQRVIFNIHGNHYRLIAFIAYESQTVFIKWIGTHAEYDRIDAAVVQFQRKLR